MGLINYRYVCTARARTRHARTHATHVSVPVVYEPCAHSASAHMVLSDEAHTRAVPA